MVKPLINKMIQCLNLNLNRKSLWAFFERWAIIIVIFLFTFPLHVVDYDVGLDPSYVWGLNWLFANDYQTLKQLIYPFGPLAFLKIPTVIGHNLFISVLFFSTIKVGFIWLMCKLSDIVQNTNKLAVIFVVFITSFFADIDFLLIGTCLILNIIYYKNKNIIPFIISVLIAFIGLFIKVSIGISALSIVGVSVLIHLFYSKKPIFLLKQAGIILFIGLFTGLLVFGNIGTFFHFLMGAYHLSGGYGDVLSLHPNNNWLCLLPFLFLMIIFPFICKEKDVRITYLLSLFPLFAAWKHSFIREDIYHYAILLMFLFVFWGIILMVSAKKQITFLFAAVSILLLYANAYNIPMYQGYKKEIAGINNFWDVANYRTFKQKTLSLSENNISKNRLSPEILAIIGDAKVDVYPWDFSYIAANQLNWKPRRTLGISLSRWISKKENYLLAKENSPQFVIFHLVNDDFGGKFGSLDGRHILNDEPLVVYNLLNNYTLLEKNDNFLLFKRDTISHFENTYLDDFQDYNFEEWIDIPSCNANEIARLKVFSNNTLFGKLKKMLYKETAYFIDYQFEDGMILTYRYAPVTAIDGLWCNPLIRHPDTDVKEPKVVKVRLRNGNSLAVKKSFKAQFQHITLKDSAEIDNVLFHKSAIPSKKFLIDMMQQADNEESKSNGFSNTVESNGYSYTYTINLDSLFQTTDADNLIVEANVRFVNYYSDACLVISAEDTEENFWEAAYLPHSISKDLWHYAYLNKLITREKHSSGRLKIYVVNFGKSPVSIDDFRVYVNEYLSPKP